MLQVHARTNNCVHLVEHTQCTVPVYEHNAYKLYISTITLKSEIKIK